MLILFSMKQSFRLESRIFWGRKEKRNFENIALLFPRTAPYLDLVWKGQADTSTPVDTWGLVFSSLKFQVDIC